MKNDKGFGPGRNVERNQSIIESIGGGEKVREYQGTKVGDIVHADILEGEVASGVAAGLDRRIKLEGIGLTDLRDVYKPEELTKFAKPGDTTWAARVIEVPDEK